MQQRLPTIVACAIGAAVNVATLLQVGCASTPTATGKAPIILVLERQDGTVTVRAHEDGPRYSIRTSDGEDIAVLVTVDELKRRHPAIYDTLERAIADDGHWLDAGLSPPSLELVE